LNADCPAAPWHIASRTIDWQAGYSFKRFPYRAAARAIKVRRVQCIQIAIDGIRKVIFVQKNGP
jgi:hypothetical protein